MIPSKETLQDGVSNSKGRTNSSPYTNKNRVQLVVDLMLVLYANIVYISYVCQSLWYFLIVSYKMLIIVLLVSLSLPWPCE